jgi:pimeloyl-ACP methyl ester carboxylesterase
VLEKWWRLSMSEGLRRNIGRMPFFDFRLVYWADYVNPEPADPNEKDPGHPLHIAEPYLPSPGTLINKTNKQARRPLKKKVKTQLSRMLLSNRFTHVLPALTESAIRKRYREIDLYYSPDAAGKAGATAQEDLRAILAKTLFDCRRRRIVLIAHSMGALIACDVLYSLEFSIDTFITIGSPLGIPLLVEKLKEEQRGAIAPNRKISAPESISGQWLNLFDPRDEIGSRHMPGYFFAPNSRGVAPEDRAVINDYRVGGRVNPHKVYGYLRCREMSEALFRLITRDRNRARLFVETGVTELLYRLGNRLRKR